MSLPVDLETMLENAMKMDPGIPHIDPTQAFWQLPPHPLARTQSESLPSNADVVIIGSGMTGLSTARCLLESDKKIRVVVFEARELCSGATGRNGGHLKPNAILEHARLVQQLGVEQANKVAAYQLQNCERVRNVAMTLCPEESEIRDVTSFSVFMNYATMNQVADSLAQYKVNNPAANTSGEMSNSKTVMKEYNIHNGLGIAQTHAGAMWPYRLVTKTWELLLEKYPRRLAIETMTPVEAISSLSDSTHSGHYTISTPRGDVSANTIIHCTNGHASHLVPGLRGRLWPVRGTMSVQEQPSVVQNHGASRSWAIVGDACYDKSSGLIDTGLLYMTQNPKTGYFFLGGERAAPTDLVSPDDTKITASSLKYLQEAIQPLFCDPVSGSQSSTQAKLVSAWSGIMGFTGDEFPLVGQISSTLSGRNGDGEFIAAGYNGYGMPTCWLAGETVAQFALGHEKPDYFPDAYLLTEERLRGLDSCSAAHEFAAMLCEK